MKRTCEVTMGAKSICIIAEGDDAADVLEAFSNAMSAAGKAVKRGERIDETRRHKSATVSLHVQPGEHP